MTTDPSPARAAEIAANDDAALEFEWSGLGFWIKDGGIVSVFRGGFIEAETKLTIEVARSLRKQLDSVIAQAEGIAALDAASDRPAGEVTDSND